jgi:hypothetical protein
MAPRAISTSVLGIFIMSWVDVFCLPMGKRGRKDVKAFSSRSKKVFRQVHSNKEIFADVKTSVEVLKIFMEKGKKSFLLES